MTKVKVFVKEVIIHEREVDMPDDIYHMWMDDELDVNSWAADQMDESTRKEVYDWIHGVIEKNE